MLPMIGASSSLGAPTRCEWLSKVWGRDDMVDHTVKVTVPIFNAAFPSSQVVFLLIIHQTIPLAQLVRFELET